MSSTEVEDGGGKFRRYRQRKAAKGLKLVRMWVIDPDAPGFAEEARRQAALLRASPDEEEVMRFIEAEGDLEGWA